MTSNCLNIILFGEGGSGKSAVVDLIAGKTLAGIPGSTDIRFCPAMSFRPYAFDVGSQEFYIWETDGLDEPTMEVNEYLGVLKRVYNLIHSLTLQGGVNLLLFCIHARRFKSILRTRNNFQLFHEALCRSKVPTVVVITHLDKEDVGLHREFWTLQEELGRFDIETCAFISGSARAGVKKYQESQVILAQLLNNVKYKTRFTMLPEPWLFEFLHSFALLAPPCISQTEILEVLKTHCALDLDTAESLLRRFTGARGIVTLLPTPTWRPSLNMVLFGEADFDRHSVVKLIAGQEVSPVAVFSDVQACTMSSVLWSFSDTNQALRIWETVGLAEPRAGSQDYIRMIEHACNLIRMLSNCGGISLLLFCIRGDLVTKTTEANYRLFYEVLFKSKVPIALVITQLEKEVILEDWWVRNVNTLEAYGIKITEHACVTTLRTHSSYHQSRADITRLLKKHEDSRNRFAMPPEQWIVEFLSSLSQFAPLWSGPKHDEIASLLASRCKLDSKIARELSHVLVSSLNVILFGETGVGKSSVINLIAGKPLAETSPDALGCTMSFKAYNFEVGRREILIWDTVGLEEPTTGAAGYLPAILNTFNLIQDLTSRGGVDLLLFCIRGNRITATTQSNYRLFYEVLCRSKVPIALVVTRLEKEWVMEEWWKRNEGDLQSKYGIKVAGHACITGIPGHSKYQESRYNMQKLLEGHKGEGKFNMPPEKWFIEFLRFFGLFTPLAERAQRKEVVKVLKSRCHLDPEIVKELADILQGDAQSSSSKNKTKDLPCPNLTREVTRSSEASALHGDTWQCTWMKGSTPRMVAVKAAIEMNTQKVIIASKYRVDLFLRATLCHKNVVPLLGIVDEPMRGLVMPWYTNGALPNYLDHNPKITLDERKRLLRDVVIGLRYLHNQGVVHGNLHSNNVLIGDDLTARLTDFSFTLPRKFVGFVWLENCDALRFADPKLAVTAQKAPDHVLSPTKDGDIYSLGGIMLHVFFGTKPYPHLGRIEIIQNLSRGERSRIPDPVSQIPIAYKELIQECWSPKEFRRPSLKDLINSF